MGGGGGGVGMKFIKNKVSHAAVFRLSGSPPRLVALLFARAGSGFLYNTKKDTTICLSISI